MQRVQHQHLVLLWCPGPSHLVMLWQRDSEAASRKPVGPQDFLRCKVISWAFLAWQGGAACVPPASSPGALSVKGFPEGRTHAVFCTSPKHGPSSLTGYCSCGCLPPLSCPVTPRIDPWGTWAPFTTLCEIMGMSRQLLLL
jgi:hypothetical protein